MPFEIVRNDIVSMQADAIVNTANPKAIIGAGTDAAINEAAGEELIKARKKIGHIARGDAKETLAYNLDAKYVIHTVGPVWSRNNDESTAILKKCYENSLALAVKLKCESVAFPLISSGSYGFPKDIALKTAVNTISSFVMENDIMVYLVVFDEKSFALSEKLFRDVENYIDEKYVEEKSCKEYRVRRIEHPQMTEEFFGGAFADEDYDICIPQYLKKRDFNELLKKSEKTFSEALLDYLIKKDKKDPEVYKKANMDRKLFSKIRNNKDYKPSKNTAIALSIALELDIDETKDFIGKAGYTLTHSSKADIIIEYFITNRNYDVFELNEVLFYYGFPLIGA